MSIRNSENNQSAPSNLGGIARRAALIAMLTVVPKIALAQEVQTEDFGYGDPAVSQAKTPAPAQTPSANAEKKKKKPEKVKPPEQKVPAPAPQAPTATTKVTEPTIAGFNKAQMEMLNKLLEEKKKEEEEKKRSVSDALGKFIKENELILGGMGGGILGGLLGALLMALITKNRSKKIQNKKVRDDLGMLAANNGLLTEDVEANRKNLVLLVETLQKDFGLDENIAAQILEEPEEATDEPAADDDEEA